MYGEGCDIFERLYAVRLDQLRKLTEAQTLLVPLDSAVLLSSAASMTANVDALDEDALLAELGVAATAGGEAADSDNITVLRHVRSSADKRTAEEIATRTPCADFVRFKPLFEKAGAGLKPGAWMTKPFVKNASIALGDFFIIGGQIAYVAEMFEGA